MGTSKDIIRHIEELIVENEELKEENKKLKAENRKQRKENERLRNRLEALESSIDERINQAVEASVEKATAPLIEIIAEKDKEILRLKAQLNKDSSNSSKPSSSNGFKKTPNKRESSGRKIGGQSGHKGNRLNIPEDLDKLVKSGLAEHIIETEVGEGEAYVSDWTVEIKIVTVYTEHRRAVGLPPQIRYGSRLKALAVYLCAVGLIEYERLSEFFGEISHNLIKVSKATIARFNHSAAANIEMEPYIEDLLNGRVINVDETPVRSSERPKADGTLETAKNGTFQVYIRTYSNGKTTVLTANPHKTEESVVLDNILTRFHGIVAQDHEAKFYNFGGSHATCGGHLTRELRGMSELQMLSWAEEVRKFFLEMNNHKNEDVRDGIAICESLLLCQYETRYDELVREGKILLEQMTVKSFGQDELRRMVNRLEKHKDHYLLFIRDYDAPFTNNQAERDLRHCKTRQKVSGCFRSWQGLLDYCIIRSFLGSAKKRGSALLASLSNLFDSVPCPAGQ